MDTEQFNGLLYSINQVNQTNLGVAWCVAFLCGLFFISLFKGRWFLVWFLAVSLGCGGVYAGTAYEVSYFQVNGHCVFGCAYRDLAEHSQKMAQAGWSLIECPSVSIGGNYYAQGTACPLYVSGNNHMKGYLSGSSPTYRYLKSDKYPKMIYGIGTTNATFENLACWTGAKIHMCGLCYGLSSGLLNIPVKTAMCNTDRIPMWAWEYFGTSQMSGGVVDDGEGGVNPSYIFMPAPPAGAIVSGPGQNGEWVYDPNGIHAPVWQWYDGMQPSGGNVDLTGVISALGEVTAAVQAIPDYSAYMVDLQASAQLLAGKDFSPVVNVSPPEVFVNVAAPVVNVSPPEVFVNVAAPEIPVPVVNITYQPPENGGSVDLSGVHTRLDGISSILSAPSTVANVFEPLEPVAELPELDMSEAEDWETGSIGWRSGLPGLLGGVFDVGLTAFFGGLPSVGTETHWLDVTFQLPVIGDVPVNLDATGSWVVVFRSIVLFGLVVCWVFTVLHVIRGAII